MKRFVLLCVCILAACSSNSETVDPVAIYTLVPSSTPPSRVLDSEIYQTLSSHTTDEGFPILGDPNAPVKLVEYGSYVSKSSLSVHDDIFTALIARIIAGDLQYVFIPLDSPESKISGGEDAIRAALCAGEQGFFWHYHDHLFALLAQFGEHVYTASQLLDVVDRLQLDRDVWEACIQSERIQSIVQAAQDKTVTLESYAGIPTIFINDNYVLPELYGISSIIDQILARVNEEGVVVPLPTVESVLTQATPDLVLEPLTSQSIQAPLSITLPDGWTQTTSDTLIIQDIDALRTLPFTVWKGQVANGTGSIVLIWAFPNLTSGDILQVQLGIVTPVPNLYIDGLRMLRLAVVERGCNIGTDLERDYAIGSIKGQGTEWSAIDCPTSSDTRGWFVGTRQNNLNFIFYIYIDPINPIEVPESEREARRQIQLILDTVVFHTSVAE